MSEARAAADMLESRLPPQRAVELRRRRFQVEAAIAVERQARQEALEARFDQLVATELRNLIMSTSDEVLPSGSPNFDIVYRVLNPESLLPRRLHNATAQSHLVVCKKCEEPTKELLPIAATLPIIGFLVMLSGLFSGLTLGLMGLDMVGLQIVAKGGDATNAKYAEKIMPVRASGNQLLCTLLLGNVAVNSALSILLADLADGLVGFIASTALIVIFGEILPQAACSRYALQVGATTVPIVHILMGLFYLLTKPMSIILDCILGREVGNIHSRTELMEMLKLQISLGAVDSSTGDMARQVAEGALNFRDKQVGDVMTPLEDAYMLSFETVLGYDKVREIFETGYSRVPVYGRDKHDYKGLLYTKDLMLADPEDEMRLGDFIGIFGRKVETFWKTTKLVECLNTFKKGGTHMGLVRKTNTDLDTSPTFTVVGVLTLEDVMEEILQEEIVDETDVYVDVDNRIKVFGREEKIYHLGVFNPVWRRKGDRLSREEVSGIAAHLSISVFSEDHMDRNGLHLSVRALEWMISIGEVISRQRNTPVGVEEPEFSDYIYHKGRATETCTLVLQGRFALRVGREEFRSDAGSFSVLAKDALRPGDYAPDFAAFLGTIKVRYLLLTKARFQEAKALDSNPEALDAALKDVRLEDIGAVSRAEAREIRQRKGQNQEGSSPTSPKMPWRSDRMDNEKAIDDANGARGCPSRASDDSHSWASYEQVDYRHNGQRASYASF